MNNSGELVVPNPWKFRIEDYGYGSHKRRLSGILFEPRSELELMIYKGLTQLLNKKDLDEKQMNLYWERWIKELRIQIPVEFHNEYFDHFLFSSVSYCLDQKKKQGFFCSGLPTIFTRCIDFSSGIHFQQLIERYKLKYPPRKNNGDNQILNIVHPGYHPQKKFSNDQWVWIPTDWKNGHFQGWINDLHPENQEIYQEIEEMIKLALPLWNECLQRGKSRCEKGMDTRFVFADTQPFGSAWINGAVQKCKLKIIVDKLNKKKKKKSLPKKKQNHVDTLDCLFPICPIFPNQCEFRIPKKKKFPFSPSSIVHSSRASTCLLPYLDLQLYVRIFRIHLTPENSRYDRNQWIIEGTQNEQIAGVAIWNFAHHNVTSSTLEFRVHTTLPPPPFFVESMEMDRKFFPIEPIHPDNHLPSQVLGSLPLSPERLICFPNILQYRFSPFELQDPTQEGYRDFLILSLINVSQQIPSTTNRTHIFPPDTLLPQSWISHEIPLPTDLGRLIAQYLSPWDERLSTQIFLEMMEQRTQILQSSSI